MTIRVETNVEGQIIDHEEWKSYKNSIHENASQPPRGKVATDRDLPTFGKVKEDPSITEANQKDLETRGIKSKKNR
jgi:hypothetical protein